MSGKERVREIARFFPSPGVMSADRRIVVTGKGGAGKTTLTALLAHTLAASGHPVLAVDEDPQENLAFSLGYPPGNGDSLVPLSRQASYIEEKVGAPPGGGMGALLTLNPDVSDVVDRFGIRVTDRISLLVMGSVDRSGTGCLCPENALLRSVVRFIALHDDEYILMDTQAGVEHFGRSLSEGFAHALVVTDSTYNAVQVARHAGTLAREQGIPGVHLVINRVRSASDRQKADRLLGDDHPFDSVFELPYDPAVEENEPSVAPLRQRGGPYAAGVQAIARSLLSP